MIFKSRINIALKLIHFMREFEKNNPDNEYLANQDIADGIDINISYAEQIMAVLKGMGIVDAKRGPGGGYFLAKSTFACNRYAYETMALFELKTAFYPEYEDASYLKADVLNPFLINVIAP